MAFSLLRFKSVSRNVLISSLTKNVSCPFPDIVGSESRGLMGTEVGESSRVCASPFGEDVCGVERDARPASFGGIGRDSKGGLSAGTVVAVGA